MELGLVQRKVITEAPDWIILYDFDGRLEWID